MCLKCLRNVSKIVTDIDPVDVEQVLTNQIVT